MPLTLFQFLTIFFFTFTTYVCMLLFLFDIATNRVQDFPRQITQLLKLILLLGIFTSLATTTFQIILLNK